MPLPALHAMLRDRRAVTTLEYGVIAGCMITALVVAFDPFDSQLTKLFERLVSLVNRTVDG
ncbi:Flp family type IVb pilin [Falsiroseomonas oryzae]|uniref:Flp family type IVb pilin n=1 Tax=Falsiroseomonas oryzae TaxID=2766473 RepID=UPI0022EB36FF|nr:hypothetical protein [Roseomonas sp. MO-31]